MNIAVIVAGIIVALAVGFAMWSKIAYRRWRKRFDAMPPDKQRKEQERLYKAHVQGG